MNLKITAIFTLTLISLINVGMFIAYQFQNPKLTSIQCLYDRWGNLSIAVICLVGTRILTLSLKK